MAVIGILLFDHDDLHDHSKDHHILLSCHFTEFNVNSQPSIQCSVTCVKIQGHQLRHVKTREEHFFHLNHCNLANFCAKLINCVNCLMPGPEIHGID